MKNEASWKPTKFVQRRNRLRHSRDRTEVGIYSRTFVDFVAAFYESAIKEHAKGDLIDLGCGKVPLYETYRGAVKSVTCVDWPASPHGGIHLDRTCDLNQPLPFADASFDTIILSDVLEHIRAPNGLWDEMVRILRPEGVILMNTPFFYWLHEEPFDYYRYTPHMLREFATARGLDVLKLEPLGGGMDIVLDLTSKMMYYGIPLVGKEIAALSQSIGGFTLIARKST
jgi:SAM-dependent methyltransferase